jgi:hypothetical protein
MPVAPHPLAAMNYIGPALGAVVFVAAMSLVPHPARRSFNAIFAAGAVGAYIGGGFGVWELIYPVLATPVVYLGLRSYRAIGIAWLMHAAWDLPHHWLGRPIWPYMRTSSLGCMIFDTLIAVWFLAGAPVFPGPAKDGGRRASNSGVNRQLVEEQLHSGTGGCTTRYDENGPLGGRNNCRSLHSVRLWRTPVGMTRSWAKLR